MGQAMARWLPQRIGWAAPLAGALVLGSCHKLPEAERGAPPRADDAIDLPAQNSVIAVPVELIDATLGRIERLNPTLNALLSVMAGFIIMSWNRVHKEHKLGRERLPTAMRVGLQWVRQSARLKGILLRIGLFFFHSTALLALLPLVARSMPGGGAGTFTVLGQTVLVDGKAVDQTDTPFGIRSFRFDADTEAWCTVPGHKEAGMKLAIHVLGAAPSAGASNGGTATTAPADQSATIDPTAMPASDWAPRDPALPRKADGTVDRKSVV